MEHRRGRVPGLGPAIAAGVVVALAEVLPPLSGAWGWFGAWRWVVQPVVAAAAVVLVLLVAASRARAAAERRRLQRVADEGVVVEDELGRARALSHHQLELHVSRCLRRDGWRSAHVEAGPQGSLVLAHRGAAVLLVACSAAPGRVPEKEVEALGRARGGHPGALAVCMTTGGFSRAALAAARELGIVPMDGEDVARWIALGAGAWPVVTPAAG